MSDASIRRAIAGIGRDDFKPAGDGSIHDYSTGELPGEDTPSWDTQTLTRDFEVLGFAAPFVSVRRRSDGVRGTLQFNHDPRVYFNFEPS